MTYTTTQHTFIIDDKHPADVFAEMANFFSLYTVTLDSLSRMSLQLCVPDELDIDGNQKLHDSYQQFIKAVRYSIPDIHILPIRTAGDDSPNDSLVLMIQYFEGRITDEIATEHSEPKPKFYQKLLGGLLPKFASEKTQEGLYPEQTPPVLTMPEPVAVPVSIPQPMAVQPVPVPVATPVLMPQPVARPQPVTSPISNPVPTRPSPQINEPQILPQVLPKTLPKTLLPKPSKSIQPYRAILTQAILTHLQTQPRNEQPITAITFKSRDSMTTAFIETVFASFSPPNTMQSTMGRAGDAIDLASYGLEELRPQLAKIGVILADDAQFLLNSKAHARPEDIALIQQGQLDPRMITLGIKLDYGQTSSQSTPTPMPQAKPSQQPTPTSQTVQAQPSTPNTLNTNRFNITINIKVRDSMGERTIKLREFPAVFSTQNSHSPNAKLIKVMTNQAQGELFYLAEQHGQLLAQHVAQGIILQRGEQASLLQDNMTLLPHDVLQIGTDVQISLLVS